MTFPSIRSEHRSVFALGIAMIVCAVLAFNARAFLTSEDLVPYTAFGPGFALFVAGALAAIAGLWCESTNEHDGEARLAAACGFMVAVMGAALIAGAYLDDSSQGVRFVLGGAAAIIISLGVVLAGISLELRPAKAIAG